MEAVLLEQSSTEIIILDARSLFDLASRIAELPDPPGCNLVMHESVYRSEIAAIQGSLGKGEHLLGAIALTREETDAEAETTIQLAMRFTDADAKTVALSVRRNYALCTDDPKLRVMVLSFSPRTTIYSTHEVVRRISR